MTIELTKKDTAVVRMNPITGVDDPPSRWYARSRIAATREVAGSDGVRTLICLYLASKK